MRSTSIAAGVFVVGVGGVVDEQVDRVVAGDTAVAGGPCDVFEGFAPGFGRRCAVAMRSTRRDFSPVVRSVPVRAVLGLATSATLSVPLQATMARRADDVQTRASDRIGDGSGVCWMIARAATERRARHRRIIPACRTASPSRFLRASSRPLARLTAWFEDDRVRA